MYVIGITGGVGAGKSEVLKILQEETNCYILKADEIANELKLKGNPCYDKIVDVLSESILDPVGEINRQLMAIAIFSDDEKRRKVDQIIHPAVKRYILEKIESCKREAKVDYLFIEAALLIEDGYKQICDEMWYVYASVTTRTNRLIKYRNYSITKIEAIMDSQLSEAEFRKNCECVINNDGDLERTREDIKNIIH